jgi:hypothetical protein
LNVKVAFETADGHAVMPHSIIVRAEQEMDFPPGTTEPGAVVAPHGPATDNGDFHGKWIVGILKEWSVGR